MKSRYKLLLMGLAFTMVGTIAYAWTDFQAAPICQGEAARFDPQAPILANGWGFDPENTRAVRAMRRRWPPRIFPTSSCSGLSVFRSSPTRRVPSRR